MTRVLIIEPAGRLWGSERALLDLISASTGLDIAVCCPPDGPLLPELHKRGIRTLPYLVAELHRKSRWRRLRVAFNVARAVLAFRPDVMHLNQAGIYRVVLFAARLFQLPVVCHVRLFDDASYLAARRPTPRHLKAIIAISGAVADEIASFPALSSVPVHKIYDAYSSAPSLSASSNRWRTRIVCAGRIVETKGHEVLLSALGYSAMFPPGTECLIAGSGEPRYVALLKENVPESDNVTIKWLGFVEDMISLLQSAGVLVCPSHREPLGRVIFEAWDSGAVPVVYAGAGGSAELVAAADGGILYDEQTPECLARAMAKAMTLEPVEAARLVANGRDWMTQHCNIVSYGAAISAVFRAAAA